MIALAAIYTHSFYGIKWFFQRVPLPRPLKPARRPMHRERGPRPGLYSVFEENPRVLKLLRMLFSAMASCNTATAATPRSRPASCWSTRRKILTTGLTISSGGSGGVFGPSMVIGGCGGGALGMLLHAHFPAFVPHPSSFLIVGMAGFFAAAAKDAVLDHHHGQRNHRRLLAVAADLVGVLADISFLEQEVHLLGAVGIPIAIAGAPGGLPSRDPGEQRRSAKSCRPPKRSRWSMPTRRWGIRRAARLHDCPYPALPVIDVNHHVVGVLNLLDLKLGHPESKPVKDAKVGDVMQKHVLPLHPEDRLDKAARLFVDNELPALPVVKEHGNPLLVGGVPAASIWRRFMYGSSAKGE